MTILITYACHDFIVATADSAKTDVHADHREYSTVCKQLLVEGVGYVGTWGELGGNHFRNYLKMKWRPKSSQDVVHLADVVNRYLRVEWDPARSDGADYCGFHVAGFDGQGVPRLFHTFWGVNQPPCAGETAPTYQYQEHPVDVHTYLYNGRNDLAWSAIHQTISEIDSGGDPPYGLSTPTGVAQFLDSVARRAAEVTREVGPPFVTHVLWPDGFTASIVNHSFDRLADAEYRVIRDHSRRTVDFDFAAQSRALADSADERHRISGAGTAWPGDRSEHNEDF